MKEIFKPRVISISLVIILVLLVSVPPIYGEFTSVGGATDLTIPFPIAEIGPSFQDAISGEWSPSLNWRGLFYEIIFIAVSYILFSYIFYKFSNQKS